ncbi:MAG: hypothetical protein ACJ74W_15270 [Pyrinomonadaceae bacterium]
MATAGLFIKPVEGFATMPGVWDNIKGFFFSFGKNILFNLFQNLVPASLTGFAGLSAQALGQVTNGGFTGWGYVPDCFGNSAQNSLLLKLLGLVGSGRKLNAAVPYLNKEIPDAIKLLFSLPAFTGLSDIVSEILKKPENLAGVNFQEPTARFLNAGFSEEHWYLLQAQTAQQKYFLPLSTGKYAKYATQTMTTPKPLNEPFKKPHLFESEMGALILVDYELGKTRTDRSGKVTSGDGAATIYVIPPKNKRNIVRHIPDDPNFLADKAKVSSLKQRIVSEGLLAAGSKDEKKVFQFEVE